MNHHPSVWVFTLSSLGREDPLEEGMATHTSILGLENPMNRRAWQTTVCGFTELDTTEQLNTYTNCSTLENSDQSLFETVRIRLVSQLDFLSLPFISQSTHPFNNLSNQTTIHLLWSECLCPSKMHMLKSQPPRQWY